MAEIAVARVSDPAICRIDRLALQDFRNYPSLDITPPSGSVVLHGPNGAGKTNLLEAISLLSPGRGLRGAKLRELDRKGGQNWILRANLKSAGERHAISIGRDADKDRKTVKIGGTTSRSQRALGEICAVLWLTPSQDRLFSEASSGRRRFLDRLVLAMIPDHARHVSLYERSLRERAHLLRRDRGDPSWLQALEQRIAEAAIAVAAARRSLVEALNPVIADVPFVRARPHLSLAGDIETWLGSAPALEVEQRYIETLKRTRSDDALTGGAAVGPHRSDLLVHDVTSDEPAAQVSTGRQKILLISIVLAEIRLRREQRGDSPLLLLDEIPAHLDQRHRAELFEVVLDLETQCWMTGTEASLFASLARRAAFYRVQDAKLEIDERQN